ncbi:prolyl oligopeptidase family serine peptidase [Arenimonas caeni]|jgi:prolyl oligopeptidase|uniref:prolyl oligopeptidase family serine peptidase n=1 Tax=Arenimonas caeni TaxID=2058085 RepID=UPI002A36FF68|nr:prolyl oligopeptidase family serine peptidase [Arenimonas caeni]MDY0021451.1 prolyl oligopeptidase family serine peptidase [Arenimonas caeni]
MRPTALAWLVAGALSATAPAFATEPAAMNEDPYLWLEDVEGEKALDWVRARNAVSTEKLGGDPRFEQVRADLLEILDSNARIPYVGKMGGYYYNFWRDKLNPQGVWRRTTLEEYRKDEPKWEVLLDIDALGKAEGVNWVWAGADCLRPDYDRCLIDLSRGGADATVTREFDVSDKAFVEGGFSRPEAKGQVNWIDIDTVYVSTDFGDGSMTDSGYPRIAKEWKRGTPLSEARTIFEGQASDISVGAYRDDTPGWERDFVYRGLTFYTNELYLRGEGDKLTKLDLPDGAQKGVFREWLSVELRQPWAVGGKEHPAGSLLAIRLDAFLAGSRDFDVLFEPTENTSLASAGATRDYYFINVLEDVKNRIYVLTPGEDGWKKEPLVGAPQFGTVGISAVDADESNAYFMTVADYLTPTSLLMGEIGKQPEVLKQLPAFFDASPYRIEQHFATSKDGTRVPYFMVSRKDLQLDGDNPTLLYGYGGFEVSLTPGYQASVGRAWLADGGVYVVANIRGGGEYGPRWHQAALKANRNKAYEDFAAVAEDLIARKVTQPKRLGIQGGSNGGLLMGNMTVMYPQLFGAVVCQVPLLDMKRYHLLLAGASWMAEYGDPDKPEEWEFLRKYSPYQNVARDVDYPPVLFTTSTRDDRVHPGHARKMMALMEAQGHDVTYYENIEGGHGGAANNAQSATMGALAYTFLKQKLFEGK